jgi:hypothetical protein
MGSGNLILAKKMAQSIIKDGAVRDMDLFNDISVVLKQAIDDPEAKSLLNRITLIRLSTLNQNRVNTPPPPQSTAPVPEKVAPPVQPQNITPVPEKINPPVQPKVAPPVQTKVNPPVQPKVTPPAPVKVNPPVQPKNKIEAPVKTAPVQNKAAAPAQPRAVPPPVPVKVAAPKDDASAAAPADEPVSGGIPIGLWLLAIILVLPGGIIASMMARKKYPAKSGALLFVGILTSVIAAMLVFILVKYTIKF